MNVLDLFCGCGGFSIGFEKAGHQVKYGIDNWKGCQETFEYNHSNTEFILEDINNLDPMDFINVDIIIGSPPCQEFSYANNNPNPEKGMELVNKYLEWIKMINPKYWIMENVQGIMKFLKRFLGSKFPIIKLLNCADYGVPQKRKRCFSGNFKIPFPTHNNVAQKTLTGEKLEKWVTVIEAIGDIIFIEPNQETLIVRSKKFYKRLKQNIDNISNQITTKDDCLLLNHHAFNSKLNPELIGKYQSYKTLENDKPSSVIDVSKGMSPLINHECFDNINPRMKAFDHHKIVNKEKPAEVIHTHMRHRRKIEILNHECFDNMKEINYESANREIKLEEPAAVVTSKDRCKKKLPILSHIRTPETTGANAPFYTGDNPARTMTTFPHSIMENEKKVYRRLTVRECARLQSFPDDFIFFGSLSSQYKMVGNAVPPLMAYHLGKELKNTI